MLGLSVGKVLSSARMMIFRMSALNIVAVVYFDAMHAAVLDGDEKSTAVELSVEKASGDGRMSGLLPIGK